MEDLPATRFEFLDSLPEASGLEVVIRDFFDDVRVAVNLDDVNVAAGIAYQRLS